MKTFCMTFSLLFTLFAFGETTGSKGKAAVQAKGSAPLPHCVSDNSEVEAIKEKIKANSKTQFKYDGYKKALASDSDEELMARLIYAETKGANCDEQSDKVSSVVTTVIANRVKIRNGDVKSVVFERDQFASSLNIYEESHYKEFLCPSDSALWSLALRRASLALSDKAKPTSTVNYFLYKHSPRWTKEPWKLEEDTAVNNASTRACIRAFKNSKYK